jgi:DNA-binding GntR family transcriptional regulator
VTNWEEAELADRRFHERLYSATNNRFFADLGRRVAMVRAENAWIKLKSKSFTPQKWTTYRHEHELIAFALHHRDAEQARALLKDHLLGVRKNAQSMMGDL